MLTYEEYKTRRKEIDDRLLDLDTILGSFERDSYGLIVESIRTSEKYVSAKKDYDQEFKRFRDLNKIYTKIYKKEIWKDISLKRGVKNR